MIKLKSLHLKNFLSFHEATLDLQKPGLYLINGWDVKGQGSNGSGKSSLLNAICFCLFGRTTTGLTKDQVKRWNSQDPMEVSLTLLYNNDTYVIKRTETSVLLYINDQPMFGHKRDIQTTINELFKTNYDLFLSSTLFTASRVNFLLAQTDAERKQLFKSIFQLEEIDKIYKKIKDKNEEISRNLDSLETGIVYTNKDIKEHSERKDKLTEKSEKYDLEVEEKIKGYERKIGGLKTSLTVEEQAVKEAEKVYNDLSAKLESEKGAIDEIKAKLNEIGANRAYLHSQLSYHSALLSETESWGSGVEVCKYCGSPLSRKLLGRHKREIQRTIERLQEDSIKLDNESLELDRRILLFDKLAKYAEEAKATLTKATNSYQMAVLVEENNKQRIKELEAEIAKLKDSPNPYKEQIIEETRLLEEKVTKLKELEGMFNKLSEDFDVYSFLKWVFSKEGLISFIIERAFARLESLANKYLSLLSSEGYAIEIRPQKELKSKAVREEIDIVIRIGNRIASYWTLSAGQRQRFNIALLLAIYRLCKDKGMNNFGFLLLDEVLDLSMDSKGQFDIIDLLRRLLSTEIHNIFVISHKDEIKGNFDHLIEVERNKEGISRIL